MWCTSWWWALRALRGLRAPWTTGQQFGVLQQLKRKRTALRRRAMTRLLARVTGRTASPGSLARFARPPRGLKPRVSPSATSTTPRVEIHARDLPVVALASPDGARLVSPARVGEPASASRRRLPRRWWVALADRQRPSRRSRRPRASRACESGSGGAPRPAARGSWQVAPPAPRRRQRRQTHVFRNERLCIPGAFAARV